MKISATVITLNEQRHIRQCLESLQGIADEMIVLDSGSQDATLKIAAELGAKIFVHEWTNYAEQKNLASSLAEHEWILSLDADECLSSSLRQDILHAKENATQAVAFEFPRKAFYLGRWIEHSGWYPDHKVRLFLKNKARWEGRFVHESLLIDGPIVRLSGDLLHYSCESISEHLRTLDRYTTLAAEDLWHRQKRSGWTELLGSAFAALVKTYWLKQGFRDGMQGFVIACFAGYYNFVKYAKVWELERRNR
ncbi:MAG: glycosyltransferase family 2 protein [Acidobacteria bacterium]|nr:glycosyltransferase family 2 protein [Acidobacteriota bacterium]